MSEKNQLTPEQQRSQRIADQTGRALVTMIDGRVAIILPMLPGKEQQADWIHYVVKALDAAHIGKS